jgi:hypothetical protein
MTLAVGFCGYVRQGQLHVRLPFCPAMISTPMQGTFPLRIPSFAIAHWPLHKTDCLSAEPPA